MSTELEANLWPRAGSVVGTAQVSGRRPGVARPTYSPSWRPPQAGGWRPGYLGPAPPPGDGPHHYVFRLLAVDTPVQLQGLPSYQDVEAAAAGHILGEARLTGTYQR